MGSDSFRGEYCVLFDFWGGLFLTVIVEIFHSRVYLFFPGWSFCLLGIVRTYFVFIYRTTLTLHLSVFDSFLEFLLLTQNVLSQVVVECFYLDFSLLEDLLHLCVIGFVKVHLGFVLVLSLVQLGSLALLYGLL